LVFLNHHHHLLPLFTLPSSPPHFVHLILSGYTLARVTECYLALCLSSHQLLPHSSCLSQAYSSHDHNSESASSSPFSTPSFANLSLPLFPMFPWWPLTHLKIVGAILCFSKYAALLKRSKFFCFYPPIVFPFC
jgi:hypothetical protein